ncbi:type II secretion system F family protein [Arthrobacter sulfonylureivorans]|uniref:type II secretion system F family protein n=1 Tax=Arthrobacter sulfonylureivorans TaxID=2486855 RepID=UPI0039E6800E
MSPALLIAGILLCYGAVALLAMTVLDVRPVRLAPSRRGAAEPANSGLSAMAARTTAIIEGVLARRREASGLAAAIEAAGLTLAPAELVVMVLAGSAAGAALGLLLAGPVGALLLAVASPAAAKTLLVIRAGRRRAAFADQLDDSLQLLASGLRAGHSLLRAVDAVSTESPAPTSQELRRVINETRLGRDLGESLRDTADRMGSQDFHWVAQAIDIHREVGGNLAEVLDQVSGTIRERSQIRGQVKALSAEGRISALVLMVLPFGLGGFLLVASPGYLDKFTQSPLGFMLLAVGAGLLVAGGLWLRKVVSFTF